MRSCLAGLRASGGGPLQEQSREQVSGRFRGLIASVTNSVIFACRCHDDSPASLAIASRPELVPGGTWGANGAGEGGGPTLVPLAPPSGAPCRVCRRSGHPGAAASAPPAFTTALQRASCRKQLPGSRGSGRFAGTQRIRWRALTLGWRRFTVRAMLCRLSSRFIARLAARLLITVFSVMSPAIGHWSTRADECEPTAVKHDTNAHRFVRSETAQTDAGHCWLCHSTRAFRSDLSSKPLLPQPARLLGWLLHDSSAWAAHVASARIPARSPPAPSVV